MKCLSCIALKKENSLLKKRIRKLEAVIKKLKTTINAVRQYCFQVAQKAKSTLSQKSGIAPRSWGYSLGADAVSKTTLGIIQKLLRGEK